MERLALELFFSTGQRLGDVIRLGWNDIEDRHRMAGAIFAYPLFENGIRAHHGRSIDEHLLAMGQLFSRFAAVAANNPLADRRDGFSAQSIATVNDTNPYIGFPCVPAQNAGLRSTTWFNGGLGAANIQLVQF